MARRRVQRPAADAMRMLHDEVRSFEGDMPSLSLRQKVCRLALIRHRLDELGISFLSDGGIERGSASDRILAYLRLHPQIVIDGAELAVVAGIQDYPRRIRELRTEHGYQIVSGASSDPEAGLDLAPDQYMLVSAEPNAESASLWRLANRIRNSSIGSREKILEYLLANVGLVVTTEELKYVSGDASEFGRRTRELRTEQGYPIATRFTGRPDLAPGQYILQSRDRLAQPHDRKIPLDVERAVYARDNNTCRCCGWSRETSGHDSPRILELHHREHHAQGGENSVDNLVVLCSRCHDEVHAGRIVEVESSSGRFGFAPAASLGQE